MKSVIIYGAGSNGRKYYEFLKSKNKQNIIFAFCDRKFKTIKYIGDKKVISYDEAKYLKIPFLVSIDNSKEVIQM